MSGRKIKSLGVLKKIVRRLKREGKTVVFTNGCFDILHFGHVMYLEQAREQGDILVVAVNSDASVKKIKGAKRPIVNEKDRARVVAGLAGVDYVLIFNETTPERAIKELGPDILVKGSDWKKDEIAGGEFVRSRGGKVLTIKLARGRSTTGLIRKINQAR